MNKHKSGSVLVAVLSMIVVLMIIAGSVLEISSQEYKLSKRSLAWNQALATAESGIEFGWSEANKLTAINTNGVFYGDKFQWNEFPQGTFTSILRTLTPSAGSEFSTTYYVILNTNEWTIFSKGIATSPQMFIPVSRMILVKINPITPFEWAILSKGQISFSGTNPTVDSWNSVLDGGYNATSNRRSNGSIGSNGILIEASGSEIYGSIMTGPGGVVTTSPGFNVHSDATTRNGTNVVTDGLEVYIPDVLAPWIYGDFSRPLVNESFLNSATISGNVEYEMTNVKDSVLISGSGTVIIYVDTINQNGGDTFIIAPNPPTANLKVIIFAKGDIDFGGNSGINNPFGAAQNLQIYGLPSCKSIKIGGNNESSAAIYAPSANINLHGTADFFGSVVGDSVSIGGSVNFHYDESLDTEGQILGFSLVSWSEK